MISAEEFMTQHPAANLSFSQHNEAERAHDIARYEERPEEENKCQEAALRLLDAASRPSGALRKRLLDKEYDEDVVDRVVNRLIQLNLIDDESYARSAVRYCISRDMGEIGTQRELERKGVDKLTAAQAVSEAHDTGAFEESARKMAQTVAQRTRGLDRQTKLRRLWATGSRKGHSPDLIRVAADELFVEESESAD